MKKIVLKVPDDYVLTVEVPDVLNDSSWLLENIGYDVECI